MTNSDSQFERTELLLGENSTEILRRATVAVFGVGGVGGYAVEALARAGIGTLVLVDSDKVALSNINRQIIATHSSIGMAKVEVAKARILEINPKAEVVCHETFYSEDTKDSFDFASYDYVVDAIDSVRSKIDLIVTAKAAGASVISAMGAGNKLDPTAFKVADISKTAVCPLAKAVRLGLRRLGIRSHKVVYSEETPVLSNERTVGSVSFVPSVMGLIIAGEVIKDLTEKGKNHA